MEVISTERFWIFVLSLVAVINGLGIVRLLSALSDCLRKRDVLSIQYYWVHTLYIIFHLLMYLLIWWAIESKCETDPVLLILFSFRFYLSTIAHWNVF